MVERGLCDVDGLLDNRHVEDGQNVPELRVAVGLQPGPEMVGKSSSPYSVLVGYKGVVSLEMEDLFTCHVEAGAVTSIDALEATISK